MSDDSHRWHWAEGTKYVLEGTKTLVAVNGAGAISILTFVGNTKIHSGVLIIAMVCFALGALTGVPIFYCAYLTQLNYGNAHVNPGEEGQHSKSWNKAERWHVRCYWCAAIGIFSFLLGIVLAAYGLY
jgi:hypothetical protein